MAAAEPWVRPQAPEEEWAVDVAEAVPQVEAVWVVDMGEEDTGNNPPGGHLVLPIPQ